MWYTCTHAHGINGTHKKGQHSIPALTSVNIEEAQALMVTFTKSAPAEPCGRATGQADAWMPYTYTLEAAAADEPGTPTGALVGDEGT